MNRFFRSIWNERTGTFIAASEITGNRGKRGISSSSAAPSFAFKVLIAATASVFSVSTNAQPTGGQVVAGTGTIRQTGNTTTVNQSTPNLSIDWKSFNIGASETVNFVQPNASSIAVNRIYDPNASQILGHLNGNGQIFLLNPKGILFGKDAQVNVGGLVASTLDSVSMNGNAVSFNGKGTGAIKNEGMINGRYVALIGNTVSNTGTITANRGAAALGAGSAVTLTFAGNDLVSLQVDKGTLNSLVENGGLVQADGGSVVMTAGAKDEILASVVNNTGVIEARTVEKRPGKIILLAGMAAGTTKVGGTLDASAPNGGNGGAIETSGAHVKVASDTSITTLASDGSAGSWLIDPVDFTVATGGDMTGATLSFLLGGGNIGIQSTSGASGSSGDININDSVSWSANLLSLSAQNNININNTMMATGTAGLALKYGQATTGGGTAGYNVSAPVYLAPSASFQTQQGSTGTPVNWTIISNVGYAGSTSGTDLQGMNGNLAGHYVLGTNLDASPTATWNVNLGFTPVGATAFTGTLDGLGHTVYQLAINRPTTDQVGLFGSLGGTGEVRNIGLVGGSVVGNNSVGSLVGVNDGTVRNSFASGTANGSINVGGLVGVNNCTVTNTYATGNVKATTSGAGGLVGNNYGTVSNSFATGVASGTVETGGLVGGNYVTVTGSFWDQSTSGTTTGIGGGTVTGATGMTTSAMQAQNNFVNSSFTPTAWDFTHTWKIYEGHTYPLLRAFMKPLTVTANNLSQTYNGTVPGALSVPAYSASGADTSGHLFGLTSPYSGDTNVGTYTPSLWSDQQGYLVSLVGGTLTVNPAPLTALMTARYKTYDGTTTVTPSFNITSGLVGMETLSVTGTATFADKNAGNGKTVTANSVTLADGTMGGKASNYTLAAGETATVGILPANLTVSGVTALSKVYDGTTAATVNTTGAVLTGLVAGDSVAVNSTGTFTDRNAGNGKRVTLSYGGADQGNYTIATVSDVLADITPKTLTVTGEAVADKVYDGTAAAVVHGGALSGLIAGDAVALNEGGNFASQNAGNNIAVTVADALSGLQASNYTLTQPTGFVANITPKALTATMAAANKTYDGTTAATPSFTVTSGLVGTETLSVTGTATFSDKNAGNGKTVTANSVIIADGTMGGKASNYTLAAGETATANILPANLTVSGVTALSKVYDGTTAATVNTAGAVLTGMVGGDSVAVNTTGAFADKNAGNGKRVTLSYGGTDQGNYTIATSGDVLAAIMPKALSVSGITASDKVYDGTAAAAVNASGATLTGLLAGDNVTVSATGTFADKNVASGKPVAISSTYDGADRGNYTIRDQAETRANITPAKLTYTANPETVNQGELLPALSGQVTGFVASDDLAHSTLGTLSWTTTANATSDAGRYPVAGSGLSASNYEFVQDPANASALTIQSKTQASPSQSGSPETKSQIAAIQTDPSPHHLGDDRSQSPLLEVRQIANQLVDAATMQIAGIPVPVVDTGVNKGSLVLGNIMRDIQNITSDTGGTPISQPVRPVRTPVGRGPLQANAANSSAPLPTPIPGMGQNSADQGPLVMDPVSTVMTPVTPVDNAFLPAVDTAFLPAADNAFLQAMGFQLNGAVSAVMTPAPVPIGPLFTVGIIHSTPRYVFKLISKGDGQSSFASNPPVQNLNQFNSQVSLFGGLVQAPIGGIVSPSPTNTIKGTTVTGNTTGVSGIPDTIRNRVSGNLTPLTHGQGMTVIGAAGPGSGLQALDSLTQVAPPPSQPRSSTPNAGLLTNGFWIVPPFN